MGATRIGVLGAGRMNRKLAVSLLKDFVHDRQVEFYVVGSPFDDAARYSADWALMNGIPTTVFVSEDEDGDFGDYTDAEFLSRSDVVESLITVLARGGEGSSLLYAFDESDGEEALLLRFLKAGVEVLDFAEGLYPVTFEDDGQADDTPSPAEEPEEEKVETPAEPAEDPDAGLEPEAEEETVVVPDEAQQPPARKPRQRKPKVVEETPEESSRTITSDCTGSVSERLAQDGVPPLGDEKDPLGRYMASPQVQELIELGRAVKVLLDYIAKK